jgi:hypothetical protein
MRSVNFIPMRRREQRKVRARRRGWTIAAAVYAAALGVGCLGWRAVWSTDSLDVSHELAIAKSEYDDATRATGQLRAALVETRQRLTVTRTVAAQPDWSLLMALVANVRGDDVILNHFAVEVPPDGSEVAPVGKGEAVKPMLLHLGGYGRTQTAVSQFVLRLEHSDLFDSVQMVKTNREPFLATEAVAFKLDCQLKAGRIETPQTKGGPSVADLRREP